MKKIWFKLLIIIMWFPLLYFVITQLAYFLSFHYDILKWKSHLKIWLPWNVVYWQGDSDYFRLSMLLAGLTTAFFLLTILAPSGKDRTRKIKERSLTKEEKLNNKHLAKRFEIKRNLQRLSFTDDAKLNHLENQKIDTLIGKYSIYILVIILWVFIASSIYSTVNSIIKLCNNNFTKYKYNSVVPFKTVSIFIPILIFVFFGAFFHSVYKYEDKTLSKASYLINYFRDYCNYCFDDFKKVINSLLISMHLAAYLRFNTLKKMKINGKETYFRSGVPIYCEKYAVYVDSSDSHTLVLGTTNSGKSSSIIAPMIMNTMIAGESMLVNDIKLVLRPIFYQKLIEKGYNVISIDFIHPEKSNWWNPLSVVISKYRKTEKEYHEKMISSDSIFKNIYQLYLTKKEDLLFYFYKLVHLSKEVERSTEIINFEKYGFSNMEKIIEGFLTNLRPSLMDSEKVRIVNMEVLEHLKRTLFSYKKEMEVLKDRLPSIDYSEALEYLRDISNMLFKEKDSKNMFFWQQAQLLFEGIMLYLLEYDQIIVDENKKPVIKKLEDNQINFTNIKIFKDEMEIGKFFGSSKKNDLISHFLLMKSSKDFSMRRMSGVLEQPKETKANIFGTFDTKIEIGTMNESIARMTSQTNFDFHDLGTKPTALFIGVHDEKETYYPFVTMLIKQAYEELVKTAREDVNQRLPVPLNIIWDEFGISPALKDIDNMLSAMRFRGIRMTMVIQDFSQLDEKYGKNIASSIKNNVMNTIYLLAGEKSTLEDISYKAGHQLSWNKELNRFDKVPIMPPERLSRFQYGEALILSQRKNPIYTHLREFKKYGYYKKMGKPSTDLMDSKLPELNWFLLTKEWQRIQDFQF